MTPRLAFALAAGLAWHVDPAHASYGQMTLPGLAADLLFLVIAAVAILIDIVLLCRGFRSRTMVIMSGGVSVLLLSGLYFVRDSVGASFDLLFRKWQVWLLAVALVLVPLTMLAAPVWQFLELRQKATRRAAYVAIGVQALLIGVAWTFDYFDAHPLTSTLSEWASLRERGAQVKAGEIAALRDEFEKRHNWGSDESRHLLKGVDASVPVRSGAALGPEDRRALADMVERDQAAARPRDLATRYYPYIDTKLLWDTLEPGSPARQFPLGTTVRVNTTVLLEYIDAHGPARLCSPEGLLKPDRQALSRVMLPWNTPELRAPVDRSLDRLEDACRATVASQP